MKKTLLVVLVIVAIVTLALAFFGRKPSVGIEEFVKENISSLSSEKAVLGGTFYVTKIEAGNGKGTVWYEDGHIALVADFTYGKNQSDETMVKNFTVRK